MSGALVVYGVVTSFPASRSSKSCLIRLRFFSYSADAPPVDEVREALIESPCNFPPSSSDSHLFDRFSNSDLETTEVQAVRSLFQLFSNLSSFPAEMFVDHVFDCCEGKPGSGLARM